MTSVGFYLFLLFFFYTDLGLVQSKGAKFDTNLNCDSKVTHYLATKPQTADFEGDISGLFLVHCHSL